ncbi:hypothetical protein GGR50DRAFT_694693 [Xylaria sp. CBS 124048]|nr:hypothetical protein GGR50DRAFT_694693 [Xylaria sp. CBS 124048]
MVNIEVQPPSQVQRGSALWPPLVVSCQSQEYTFYQVLLVDASGDVASTSLRGTVSANPQALYGSSGSGNGSNGHSSSQPGGSGVAREYAVFPDLSITKSGTYTLYVNAYQMDYSTAPPAWVHVATATSRTVRVRTSSVAAERPSSPHHTPQVT